MERQFGIGLFVGFFVSGVASLMIDIGQQLGIGLIIIAFIWAFLFVNPKSPVRKIWWSISGKLGITALKNYWFNDSTITIPVGYNVIPSVQVDRIALRIRRQRLIANYACETLEASGILYLQFPRPDWLNNGKYEAYLIAYTPEGFSKSKKFSIDFS